MNLRTDNECRGARIWFSYIAVCADYIQQKVTMPSEYYVQYSQADTRTLQKQINRRGRPGTRSLSRADIVCRHVVDRWRDVTASQVFTTLPSSISSSHSRRTSGRPSWSQVGITRIAYNERGQNEKEKEDDQDKESGKKKENEKEN